MSLSINSTLVPMLIKGAVFSTAFMFAAQAALAVSPGHLSYQLTNYLDTGTQVPGADLGVLFTSFDNETPAFSNGVLTFHGRYNDPGSGSDSGIFTVDAQGLVTKIVFDTDIAPVGGPYSGVRDELIADGMVSWRGNNGLYITTEDGVGPVVVIADTTTVVPDGSLDLFTRFGEHGRDGDFVLFNGRNAANNRGLYIRNLSTNALSVFADETTSSPFPGAAATLVTLREPMTSNNLYTANAIDSNGGRGLITDFGSGIVGPVNGTVASPSGLGNFTAFDESSISGDYVVFQAGVANSGFGVYLYNNANGTFSTIAHDNTPRPGGGFFDGFNGNPSLSVNNGVITVIFQTGDSVPRGTWAWINGTLISVVSTGDVIDGKIVTDTTHRQPYGAEGTTIAVKVDFDDGSEALFLAVLDTPEVRAIPTLGDFMKILLILLLVGVGVIQIRGRYLKQAGV